MPQFLRHDKIDKIVRLDKKKNVVLYKMMDAKTADAERPLTILTYLYFIQRARERRLYTIVTYLRQ